MKPDLRTIESSMNTCVPPLPVKYDPVTYPEHYNQGSLETIDAIMGLGLDPCEGNVLKYISRHRHKNGRDDIEKAIEYCNIMLRNYDQWYK